MSARVRFERSAENAIEYAATQDGYGGAMFDQAHDGRLIIFTTANVGQLEVRVGDLLSDGSDSASNLWISR